MREGREDIVLLVTSTVRLPHFDWRAFGAPILTFATSAYLCDLCVEIE